jgi:hypothetical protein
MNRCLHRSGGPRVHELETHVDAYPWLRVLRFYRWTIDLDDRVVAHGRTWTYRGACRESKLAKEALALASVVDPELTGLDAA